MLFSTHNKVILLLLISSLFCFVFSFFCIEIFQEGLWKDTSFKDPDLQSLSSRLQATVLLARAPGTVKMYDRAFRKWKEFALRKQELSYFPANPMHVAVYLQHVLESTRSSASVDTAFYSIKWAHESAGLVSPTDNPLVNRVRDAGRRILGTKRGNRKEPLSIEILKDIIAGSDLSNTLQLRNVCLYVLCYAGFFRSEEVTGIRRSHIKFFEDHMIIKVEKSKTDQLRQGDEVVIARSGGSACPVSILQQYLSRLNIDPYSDELIFRQLVKTKSSYKMVSKDKPISYSTFRDHLSKSLRSIVPDLLLFTAPTRLGQVGLPWLPIVEWAIAFFRGTGDGRVFQPRTAMLKMILHLGFQYLNP